MFKRVCAFLMAISLVLGFSVAAYAYPSDPTEPPPDPGPGTRSVCSFEDPDSGYNPEPLPTPIKPV